MLTSGMAELGLKVGNAVRVGEKVGVSKTSIVGEARKVSLGGRVGVVIALPTSINGRDDEGEGVWESIPGVDTC